MKNNNPDISIIVPVYNVEKHLVRCLDSIFNQKFTGSFEVIAVEDGSVDNSLHVLKSYQESESRLKVIEHGVNKKLSIARSTGMKAATGDYIMHVDSDDWLLEGVLECLQFEIKQTDADVIVFNYLKENPEGKRTYVRKIKGNQFITDKVKVHSYFYGACWNKIVKRSLTINMVYGQKGINNGEDLLYATEIFIRAQKIALIPNSLYVYFVNNSSLTQTAINSITIKTLSSFTHELSNLLNHYKETEISQNLYDLRLLYIINFIIRNYSSKKQKITDINPLIIELEKFPNNEKTKINLCALSNNRFYFLLQICLGRINYKKAHYFFQNPFLIRILHFLSKYNSLKM